MMELVYISNKRQQFRDSTLQNDILGRSKKALAHSCSCEWLKGTDGFKSVAYTENVFI